MRKNKVKRMIAMLCALALVITSYNWPLDVSAAGTITQVSAGEEQFTIDDMGYAYNRVTFSDFYVDKNSTNTAFGTTGTALPEEGTVTSGKLIADNDATSTHTQNWDKYIFQGKIKFGTTSDNGIWFGNDSGAYGFVLKNTSNSKIEIAMYIEGDWISYGSFTSADLGGPSPFDDYLDIAVSFEILKSGSSDGKMRVGVFVNGNLLNNAFRIIDNMYSQYFTWGRHIRLVGSGDGISYQSVDTEYKPEELTLNELGVTPIADCADMSTAGLSDVTGKHNETLIKKKIQMNVTPQNNTEISLGALSSNSYTGLKFMWFEHNGELWIQLYLMTEKGAMLYSVSGGLDLNWEPGATHLLEVYMEPVDYDYSADDEGNYTEDDLLISIWCNGLTKTYKLQKDGYMLQDYVGNYVCIHGKGKSVSYSSVEREGEEEEEKAVVTWVEANGKATKVDEVGYAYERLTFSDFVATSATTATGWSEGDVIKDGTLQESGTMIKALKGQKTETWDKVLFQGKVKFSDSNQDQLGIGIDNTTCGLFFNGKGSNLEISTILGSTWYEIASVKSEDIGKAPVGDYLDIAVSFEVMGTANAAPVRIGIFIEGELLYGKYCVIEDTANGSAVFFSWGKHIQIKGKENGISFQSLDREYVPKALTLNELGTTTIADCDSMTAAGKTTAVGTHTEALLNTKVRFLVKPQAGNQVSVGATLGAVYGYCGLRYSWWNDNGVLKGSFNISNNTTGAQVISIDGNVNAPFDATQLHLMEIYVEPVDCDYTTDEDGNYVEDDLLVGIWFNGQLYNNAFIVKKGEDAGEGVVLKDHVSNSIYMLKDKGSDMAYYSVPKTISNENHIEITQADFTTGGTQWAEERSDQTGILGTIRSEIPYGLKGTKLSMDILFPDSSDAKFCYGSVSEAEDRLTIYSDGSGNLVLYDEVNDKQVITLDAETAGTTLVGEYINLQISYTNDLKISDGTVSQDAIIGIWINGNFYGEDYITVSNIGSLGNSIATVGDITIRLPYESTMPKESLKQITLSDFNIKDNEKNSAVNYYSGSIKNTVFSAKFCFWQSNYFSYGSGSSSKYYAGFQFKVLDENQLYLNCHNASVVTAWAYTFESEQAGTKFIGEDFIFSMSLEEIDLDRDAIVDELKVGIFFNGKLYNNRYFYLAADELELPLGPNLGIHVGSAGNENIRYYSVDDWRQDIYLETVASDYGITDGAYEDTNGNLSNAINEITSNGKILNADVLMTEGGKIVFGGNTAEDGMVFSRKDGKLYLASVVEGKLAEQELDWASAVVKLDKAFNLKVATEQSYENAAVRVWMDDVHMGTYTVKNVTLGDYLGVEGVEISSEERNIPENYDYITYRFGDYGEYGLANKSYTSDMQASITDMASDEVVIADKMTLNSGATVTISGYTFAMTDGSVKVSKAGKEILATKVSNNTFSFALVQKLTDADGDGAKDDICLSVYVNDVLCSNRQYYLTDVTLDNGCSITANGGTAVLQSSMEAWPVNMSEDTDGYILATDKGSVVVNGALTEETALTTAGDYYITYISDTGRIHQEVAVYKDGDVNVDNEFNIKDLVALKKAQNAKGVLTKAGKHAADINDDDSLVKDDNLLRTALVTDIASVKDANKQIAFGVISDIHYVDSFNGHREWNFRKALQYYRENGAEVIIMNADISDLGTEKSYENLVATIEEVFPDKENRPQFIATADNHEYYEAWNSGNYTTVKTRFLEKLANPLGQEDTFTHTTAGGYHFIAVSSDTSGPVGNVGTCTYDETTISKLTSALSEANAADASKPIFVAVHQPPSDIYSGNGTGEIYDILKAYPQVVLFTSHSHYSIRHENSINQTDFTAVNTGSLYYIGKKKTYANVDAYNYLEHAYEFGEGLFVKVKNNQVAIERCDWYNNEKIKGDWVVTTSSDGSTLTDYRTDRSEFRTAPTWPSDATIKAVKLSDTSVKLLFDSAEHDDFVHYYRVDVYNADTNNLVKTNNYANDFYLGIPDMADTQSFVVNGLATDINYRVEVYAVETYGKESLSIRTTF